MKDETNSEKRPEARLAPGFQDYFAKDFLKREKMIRTIASVYRRFGYEPLETPALEYLDVLGKFLPESGEPLGGVFALRDDDENWLALRYDLTAPLSRVVAQYGPTHLPTPFRRYQVGPVFRRDKPGLGRFRQFYQCDFDTVGTSSVLADAETVQVLCASFAALGFAESDYAVLVNNRKIVNAALDSVGVPAVEGTRLAVLRAIDKLDKFSRGEVRKLLTVGREDSGDFTKGAGLDARQADFVLDFAESGGSSRREVLEALNSLLGNVEAAKEGLAELAEMTNCLEAMNLPESVVSYRPGIVRGLAYYTGFVFEASLTFEFTDDDGVVRRFGSVAGGGRYDNLVERFTGQLTPATGASIGIDRLLAALNMKNPDKAADLSGLVVVTRMDKDRTAEYIRMTHELRTAGIDAEMFLGTGGFKKQMRYADRRAAEVTIIAGSDEFDRGEVSIKDMLLGEKLSKEVEGRDEWRKEQPAQFSVKREEMLSKVKEILARNRNG
ncbi:MAG: histidine--tRNA ligase [Planctomycetes bacterium]|nr:histidine--tRNA ligase [Planctomycetota bacterium]